MICCQGLVECFKSDLRVQSSLVVEILCFGIENIPLLRGQIATGHIFIQPLIAPQQCLFLRIILHDDYCSAVNNDEISDILEKVTALISEAVLRSLAETNKPDTAA